MFIFQRKLESLVRARLFKGRAVLIFGPRQAGKTTLAKTILKDYGVSGEYFNCELATVRQAFVPGQPERIHKLVSDKKIVVFDEAQTIQDIGFILKTFIDTYPEVQIIATGSSSFDLANKIQEPLTGRAFEFTLLPLSLEEIQQSFTSISRNDLNEFFRLGMYPAVVAEKNADIRADILKNLATNYLYKDIYTFESVRNPRVFEDLVKLLALQAGSLVSPNELSQTLGVSRLTVEKYIRLLEQAYVIKVVRSFSKNPRTEIKKAFKVFFLDNGIRNAVIDNLTDVSERSDCGALFENFVVSERLKYSAYGNGARVMFWRSKRGEEIDVIEEFGTNVLAIECKWNDSKKIYPPTQFTATYPNAIFKLMTPDKFLKR